MSNLSNPDLNSVPLLPVVSTGTCHTTHNACNCVLHRMQHLEAIAAAALKIREGQQAWQELYRSRVETADHARAMREIEQSIKEQQILLSQRLDELNGNS